MRARIAFLLILSSFVSTLAPLASAAEVETFASPDSSFAALERFIDGADSSLRLAVYELESPDVAELLARIASRGVDVDVLVEKNPVGGMSGEERWALCRLSEGGVDVRLYDGPLRFMHAKYAIRDGSSSLVTSENMGITGFRPGGDYGNRGFGAVVHDKEFAAGLEGVFSEDSAGAESFSCDGQHEPARSPGKGAHVPAFSWEHFSRQEAELILSPGSLERLLSLVGSANESVWIEQFYVRRYFGSGDDKRESPLVEALLEKAREGVEVLVLLDSSYYNMEEGKDSNAELVTYLNGIAREEKLFLEAKTIDLEGKGLVKLHNKAVIIDRSVALVSSINWNENSVTNNREVGVMIRGEAAGYYGGIFESDYMDTFPPEGTGAGPVESDGNSGSDALAIFSSLLATIAVISYFFLRERRL